jgi:RNA polymerase sigma-70 factor (ECF subfamily)
MLEGEMGLVMAGLLTHTGYLNLMLALFFIGKVSVFASSVVLLS